MLHHFDDDLTIQYGDLPVNITPLFKAVFVNIVASRQARCG
ncbi:hypothetical protein KH172YL63_25910 [Bacillus sp. KH172YL63]|nr:hypothetical protein KH172YL63_25910 [Bacillus sp. KH172YL63]